MKKKLPKTELYHHLMGYVSDEVAKGTYKNKRINPIVFNHILDKVFDQYYNKDFSLNVVATNFVRKLYGYSE